MWAEFDRDASVVSERARKRKTAKHVAWPARVGALINRMHRAGCQLVVDGRSGLCIGAQPRSMCARGSALTCSLANALRIICSCKLVNRTLSIQDLHVATLVIKRLRLSCLTCVRVRLLVRGNSRLSSLFGQAVNRGIVS
jgi:hypothetical protein